jgi:hypothetical protein
MKTQQEKEKIEREIEMTHKRIETLPALREQGFHEHLIKDSVFYTLFEGENVTIYRFRTGGGDAELYIKVYEGPWERIRESFGKRGADESQSP